LENILCECYKLKNFNGSFDEVFEMTDLFPKDIFEGDEISTINGHTLFFDREVIRIMI
jgi:hypothetical protein